MTHSEIVNIAKLLDKETKDKIDAAVDQRMELLVQGDLTQEELIKMEECMYTALVLQEYLNGELEILAEERVLLLSEMEDMYDEYGQLLSKAKLEKKLSQKRMMALQLRQLRESLLNKKGTVKNLKKQEQEQKKNIKELEKLSGEKNLSKIAGIKLGIAEGGAAKAKSKSSGGGLSSGLSASDIKAVGASAGRKAAKEEVKNQKYADKKKEWMANSLKGNIDVYKDPLKDLKNVKNTQVKATIEQLNRVAEKTDSSIFNSAMYQNYVKGHEQHYSVDDVVSRNTRDNNI